MSELHQRFAREYLLDFDACSAAERCGVGRRRGPGLLKRPEVQAALIELQAKHEATLDLKAEAVLREIMRVAFLDPARLFDAKNNLLPLHQVPEDVRRAIAGVDVMEGKNGITSKVKLVGKLEALSLLAKHLGLIKEKVEHDVGSSLAELVKASLAEPVKPAEPAPGPATPSEPEPAQ